MTTNSHLPGDRDLPISAVKDGLLSQLVQLRGLVGATGVPDAGQITPIDMDSLLERHDPRSAAATLDVLVPVFLGQMGRSLPEIRSACRRQDASAAARLIDDATEAGSAIEARTVLQPLRLAGAAIRAERWCCAERSLDCVSDTLDALRSWYVDRSIIEVTTG